VLRSPTKDDIHITKHDPTKNTASGILGIMRFFNETRICFLYLELNIK